MIDWSGIYHILATPFLDDGALDAEGLPRLVDAVLRSGVTGITILGIAGEAHRLTDEERRRAVGGVGTGGWRRRPPPSRGGWPRGRGRGCPTRGRSTARGWRGPRPCRWCCRTSR